MFYFCSVSITSPEPEAVPARCSTEVMEARHGKVLEELAEIGMGHARVGLGHTLNETMGRPVPRPNVDPQLRYARLARSIRQTLALEVKLREPATVRAKKVQAEREQAADQAKAAARYLGAPCKSTALTAVETLIETEAEEKLDGLETAERLLSDLYEKLDDEPDDDFAGMAVSQAIERICQDLGVIPDWDLWRDEPWAVWEAKYGPPGSPYAPGWRRASADAPGPAIKGDDPP